MASSMLNGERRWVSARRGGMTVLGKVAVPKPVNLPSQRLENHGLDPNVEIVPKGTLSWGSRSSSASNAWGSPALSPPNSGGGTGSPSHLASRPSSGGTGTRPSTAGSERSHEPLPNAWGSTSRPSSASGAYVSNQTSTGARPRSADTRPGSSQLSRFAETVSESSVAWGPSGTTERLGLSSSKANAFSLSSGDFPTLGSEKSTESHVREDNSSQGRPASSSGVETPKEKLEIRATENESIDANQRGTVNTWKRDSSPYDGSGAPPSMEKWQRETHPYPNPNMPPQHFDHWHGGPVRPSPDGVWYRGPPGGPPYGPPGGPPYGPPGGPPYGPPGGPPYGTPGPPGNYPIEPFGYHHPQLPARPLPNTQGGPRPGTGPGGYHPKNGDSYRPHMQDSYVQPVMPVRPGVYPGQVPYDGYYGPPRAALCSSNERDAPVMGMATGPYVYNRYPIQNMHPDSGNFYARPGGCGPTNTSMNKEHMETEHHYSSHRGPYKVLLKQHDNWEGDDGKERREQDHATNNAQSLERGGQPGTPVKKNDIQERRNEDPVDTSRTVFGGQASTHSDDTQGSVPITKTLPENTNKTKTVGEDAVKKPETPTIPNEGLHPVARKNATLMNKIESLNNKARVSDDRAGLGYVPAREEKTKPFKVNTKAEHSTNEAGPGAVFPQKTSTSGTLASTCDVSTSAGDKRLEPTVINGAVVSSSADSAVGALASSGDGEMARSQINKRAHGAQGRADYRGKGKVNSQEGEEWRKKSLVADSPVVVPVKNIENGSGVCLPELHASEDGQKKSNPNLQGKAGGESQVATAIDPIDYKLQRAKMREIAAERARQLQREEEERTREQKAKALAKLEELNRRRALSESSTEKLDYASPASATDEHKQEISAAPATDPDRSSEVPSSTLGLNCKSANKPNMNQTTPGIGDLSDYTKSAPLETPLSAPQDPVVMENLPLPLSQDVHTTDVTDEKSAAQANYISVPKQKQMGYKRRQNTPFDKNSSEKSVPTGDVGGQKSHGNMVNIATASSGELSLPNSTNTTNEPPVQHKKKNNRGGKSKHKLDEPPSGVPLPSLVPSESIPAKGSVDTSKQKVSENVLELSLVHQQTSKGQDFQDVPSADQGWSLPPEEGSHSRANNHWKPQAPRRMPRNTQGNRLTEKSHNSDAVVWAPVRPLNKNEASDELSGSSNVESHASANDHGMQNHHKSRRAEMERYVPKPVAKELSQQGNSQRPSSPSANQPVPNETTVKADSGSLTVASGGPDASKIVPKNGESKNSKHGKAHGLWRQRGSTESHSSHVHPSQEGSAVSSDPSKPIQKPIDQQPQSLKAETLPRGQVKHTDNLNAPSNSVSEEPTGPVAVKDHGVTSRGKRQTLKGNKSNAQNTLDGKDLRGGENPDKVVTLPPPPELFQSEIKIVFGEFEPVSSNWHPKSQQHSALSRQQGNRGHEGKNVTAQSDKAPENGFPTQASVKNPTTRSDKDSSTAVVQLHPDRDNSRGTDVRRVPSGRHQEARRERKSVIDSSKEHPHSPNQGPASNSTSPVQPENIDNQHEQSSSGTRKHGYQNTRFGRHEAPHGGRNHSVQDHNNKQHQQPPANNDRRRQNSHYEYQPAKSHNNESGDLFEGGGGSRGGGSRYRERGQTHSRRGGRNFYERNSGNQEVTVSHGGNVE